MDHVHYKLKNICYYHHLAFLRYSFYASKSMTYYLFLLNFISQFLKYILLIMVLQLSQFFPLYPSSTLHPSTLQHSPFLSSCPWVVHISSLTSLFPILFLTSPCLFNAYQLCFLFSIPSVHHSSPSPPQ